MPWRKESVMSQRLRMVELLLLPDSNVSEICERFNVSRKTAYKWLNRYLEGGYEALGDMSREPNNQPNKTVSKLEDLVIATHKEYPYWGPRKLRDYLINMKNLNNIPTHTTVGRILIRNHCQVIKSNKSQPAKLRFERACPNELWQMDFKGSFMLDKRRCFPLTILDDCSRYSIGLQACKNEKKNTVKEHLTRIFKHFGLPAQINVDNGNPWGASDLDSHTSLQVWLFKLGIRLSHSSPYHPQTNGKEERFHRTLKLEVLHKKTYKDFQAIQLTFNKWRDVYNHQRPHEALEGKPPGSRYHCSDETFPDKLPQPEYESTDLVRKVDNANGLIRFQGKRYRVGKGFCGEYVAIKETCKADEWAIFFMDQLVKKINLLEAA